MDDPADFQWTEMAGGERGEMSGGHGGRGGQGGRTPTGVILSEAKDLMAGMFEIATTPALRFLATLGMTAPGLLSASTAPTAS